MKWRDGGNELDTSGYSPALGLPLDTVMGRAAEARRRQVTWTDLIATLLVTCQDPECLDLANGERLQYRNAATLLKNHLASGVTLANCLEAFDVLAETGELEINPFERANWAEPLPGLIEELPDGAGIPELLATLAQSADRLPNGDLFSALFRTAQLVGALAASASKRTVFNRVAAEDGVGQEEAGVLAEDLTARARFLLDRALLLAARTGARRCDSATLLITMLQAKDTYTQLILRRAGVSTGGAKVTSHVATATAESHPGAAPLPATASSLSAELQTLLESALRHPECSTRNAREARRVPRATADAGRSS